MELCFGPESPRQIPKVVNVPSERLLERKRSQIAPRNVEMLAMPEAVADGLTCFEAADQRVVDDVRGSGGRSEGLTDIDLVHTKTVKGEPVDESNATPTS